MSLCECGCGGEASSGCRFIQGHYAKMYPPMKGKSHSEESNKRRRAKTKETKKLNKLLKEGKIELPFCACGCGGRVTKIGNKYIDGHQSRGRFGENSPNYKGGISSLPNYCVDCGKEISKGVPRCHSCASKKCLQDHPNPGWIDNQYKKGKEHQNYKDGKCLIQHYCVDCGKEICCYAIRCHSCANRKNKIGKSFSEEHKKHLSKPMTEEGKQNVRDAANRPEVKKKNSESAKKQWGDPEIRKKMSGENHWNWHEGVSFGKYCPLFNKDLKERVREFFGRRCLLCGTLEGKEKLSVHHVNYDKMMCCNDVKPLFAPLCRKCHGKTISKRKYYEEYFTQKIIEEYGGKCFLTKEEMENEGL